jgi:hypothetical protein
MDVYIALTASTSRYRMYVLLMDVPLHTQVTDALNHVLSGGSWIEQKKDGTLTIKRAGKGNMKKTFVVVAIVCPMHSIVRNLHGRRVYIIMHIRQVC